MSIHITVKLILWINEFLTNRKQCVQLKNTLSDVITTNIGAPQGCVLSPLLYTSDCICKSNAHGCHLFKYADDTALVGLCNNNDISEMKYNCSKNGVIKTIQF